MTIEDMLSAISDTYGYVEDAGDVDLKARLSNVEQALREMAVRVIIDVQGGSVEISSEATSDFHIAIDVADHDVQSAQNYPVFHTHASDLVTLDQLADNRKEWLAQFDYEDHEVEGKNGDD